MEHSDNKEIVPDMPEMRSVRIGAPMTMPPPPPRSLLRSAPTTIKAAPLQVHTTTPKATTWSPSNIPALPMMYPLERSHYRTTEDVGSVASRIADLLREASLAPVFEDSKATGFTLCNIRFTVQLFRDGDEVVVEIQRRSGCCFGFRKVSRAILQAARGEKTASQPTLRIPKTIMKEEERRNNCKEALEIAEDLLKQDRLDAQELGMRSLVQMTRDRVCSDSTSTLLRGSVVDSVLKFFDHDKYEEEDEILREHRHRMRGFALTILANCFEAEVGKTDLNKFATDALIEKIIKELNEADKQPHNACQAARALTLLLKGSVVAQEKASKLNAPAAILYAHSEGVSRHALLEKEAHALKGEMTRCL